MSCCFVVFVSTFFTPCQSVPGQTVRPDLIVFKSGDLNLQGFLWRPSGDGPFPAVLWNHGSEKNPGAVESVATYFVEKGYVFFVPHRRGQGRSADPYIMDQISKARWSCERLQLLVDLHEIDLEDHLAGLKYLQNLNFVGINRM